MLAAFFGRIENRPRADMLRNEFVVCGCIFIKIFPVCFLKRTVALQLKGLPLVDLFSEIAVSVIQVIQAAFAKDLVPGRFYPVTDRLRRLIILDGDRIHSLIEEFFLIFAESLAHGIGTEFHLTADRVGNIPILCFFVDFRVRDFPDLAAWILLFLLMFGSFQLFFKEVKNSGFPAALQSFGCRILKQEVLFRGFEEVRVQEFSHRHLLDRSDIRDRRFLHDCRREIAVIHHKLVLEILVGSAELQRPAVNILHMQIESLIFPVLCVFGKRKQLRFIIPAAVKRDFSFQNSQKLKAFQALCKRSGGKHLLL